MNSFRASADFCSPLLALGAQGYISIALILACLSVAFFVFCWFLLSTSKVFDGLKPYLIQTCKFGSLRVIREDCKVNDMTVKNQLSYYVEGQTLILCHEPLPFAIGRRCWRIPVGELKLRDDAVYDFGITTPQGPLLCYFGQQFRSELKLYSGEQLRTRSLLN
ncbi:MAG TPA: hypothetical protein VLE43_07515 [Candidatus Saccharimonadia bacterium]|nr:hypothetical protein [Candidatus Saccharimonadia bacterium]